MPGLFNVGKFHLVFTHSLYARPIPGTELKELMLAEWGQLSQLPLGAPKWPQGEEIATVKATECREKASVSV